MTGKKIINGYEWEEEVGRGAWGKVRRVIHLETGEERAVKIMYRSTLSRKIKNGIPLLHQEYDLVTSLNNPNIIHYHELDSTSNPAKFYLFMTLCRGDISKYLPLEDTLRPYYLKDKMRQLFTGLAYLHSNSIAHHDIKIDNVLLDERGTVKICDFGVAEKFNATEGCRVFFGTPAYQAPEVVGNVDATSYDGCKADIWSAGVLLYHLITGHLPYQGSSIYLVMKAICEEPLTIPPIDYDPCLSDLLQKLLSRNPLERPSASQILTHPFFTNNNDHGLGGDAAPRINCCSIL